MIQRLAQAILSTRVGRPMGVAAYHAVLELSAIALSSLEGVRSVAVTGSFANADPGFAPGFSDLDLLLVVEPMSVADELRLRRALALRIDVLRSTVRIVRSVDVIDASDVDLIRRFSTAWSLELDERSRIVRGPALPGEPHHRSRERRRVVHAMAMLRRIQKGLPRLIDADRDSASTVRAASRLLTDALLAFTGAGRTTTLPALATCARARLDASSGDLVRSAIERPSTDGYLAASLAIVDRIAADLAETWTMTAPERSSGFEPTVTDEVRSVVRSLLDRGFASVVASTRDAGLLEPMLFAVTRESTDPRVVLESVRRTYAETPSLRRSGYRWSDRPIVVTPAMLRVAFLFDPAPIAFDALCHASALVAGDRLTGIGEPDPVTRTIAIDTTRAWSLYRTRSRRFHTSDPTEARDALEVELLHRILPIRLRGESGSIRFAPAVRDRSRSEASLIGELRHELDLIRADLASRPG